MAAVKFYCSWFCPFAQRAWISLLEKNVPFDYEEIDPYNKTSEFLSVNPRGLVPVIIQGQRSVYESSVCIEFVDEAWPGDPGLMPSDPWKRAESRILGDFISKKIVPTYYQILQRQDKTQQNEAKETMLKHLKDLCQLMSKEGPFMLGKTMGYPDIMLVPFTLRFYVLKHYRDFVIPETTEFDRLREWMTACHAKDSVKKTVAETGRLLDKYQRYADNTAKTEVADAIRGGGVMP
ncbi:hypothetical protein FSP39_001597 [Pinctada imbricata]|uniref:glutathione transferase n=1 Tax=Pinctada imbricata TaxID=66713 RepID=A0AA88YAF7_PINIB|nr:hypothetical protein FSP39_001597 [Pinctada imbricata]